MRLLKNLIYILFALIPLVFSSACAVKPAMEDISERPENECIVFGKLTLTNIEGVVKKWSWSSVSLLVILPSNTNIAETYKIKDTGDFYWSLRPGEYTIIAFANRVRGGEKIPVRIKFTVPEVKKSIYIGSLTLKLDRFSSSFLIQDEALQAISKFKLRFPSIHEEPFKKLMVLSNLIGTFKEVKSICSPVFGIECDNKILGKKFSGVIPVYPEVSAQSFPELKKNPFSFLWQPSSKEDVSYDLILYEAATYHFDQVQKVYTPGNIILYVEDIKEPKYELKEKLNEGTKYYWSVRIRKNDLISTWSKYHYFYFFVVGTSSASNQIFSFSYN